MSKLRRTHRAANLPPDDILHSSVLTVPCDQPEQPSESDISQDTCVDKITFNECYKAKSYLLRQALDEIHSCNINRGTYSMTLGVKSIEELLRLSTTRFSTFKGYLREGDNFGDVAKSWYASDKWTARNLPVWVGRKPKWVKALVTKEFVEYRTIGVNSYVPGGFLHFMYGPDNLLNGVTCSFKIINHQPYDATIDYAAPFDEMIESGLISAQGKAQLKKAKPALPFTVRFENSPEQMDYQEFSQCILSPNTIYRYNLALKRGWYWSLVVDFCGAYYTDAVKV